MSNDEVSAQLESHSDLWTGDVSRFRIVSLPGAEQWILFDVECGGPLILELEEAPLSELRRRLVDAGVEVITVEEADQIAAKHGW